MFKYLLTLTLVLTLSECIDRKLIPIPPELRVKLIPATEKCMPESGVQIDAMLAIFQGKFSRDPKFINFLYCCFNATGYLKPDGYMDIDKAAYLFRNEPIVAEGIRKCGEKKVDSPKESTYKFFKCVWDTVPVQFII